MFSCFRYSVFWIQLHTVRERTFCTRIGRQERALSLRTVSTIIDYLVEHIDCQLKTVKGFNQIVKMEQTLLITTI